VIPDFHFPVAHGPVAVAVKPIAGVLSFPLLQTIEALLPPRQPFPERLLFLFALRPGRFLPRPLLPFLPLPLFLFLPAPFLQLPSSFLPFPFDSLAFPPLLLISPADLVDGIEEGIPQGAPALASGTFLAIPQVAEELVIICPAGPFLLLAAEPFGLCCLPPTLLFPPGPFLLHAPRLLLPFTLQPLLFAFQPLSFLILIPLPLPPETFPFLFLRVF
jgi:hypothetical protein